MAETSTLSSEAQTTSWNVLRVSMKMSDDTTLPDPSAYRPTPFLTHVIQDNSQ